MIKHDNLETMSLAAFFGVSDGASGANGVSDGVEPRNARDGLRHLIEKGCSVHDDGERIVSLTGPASALRPLRSWFSRNAGALSMAWLSGRSGDERSPLILYIEAGALGDVQVTLQGAWAAPDMGRHAALYGKSELLYFGPEAFDADACGGQVEFASARLAVLASINLTAMLIEQVGSAVELGEARACVRFCWREGFMAERAVVHDALCGKPVSNVIPLGRRSAPRR